MKILCSNLRHQKGTQVAYRNKEELCIGSEKYKGQFGGTSQTAECCSQCKEKMANCPDIFHYLNTYKCAIPIATIIWCKS